MKYFIMIQIDSADNTMSEYENSNKKLTLSDYIEIITKELMALDGKTFWETINDKSERN